MSIGAPGRTKHTDHYNGWSQRKTREKQKRGAFWDPADWVALDAEYLVKFPGRRRTLKLQKELDEQQAASLDSSINPHFPFPEPFPRIVSSWQQWRRGREA